MSTRAWLGLLSGLAACQSVDDLQPLPNELPVVEITSPGSNSAVVEGQTFAVTGTVSDEDHALEELEVRWRVDDEVVCGPSGVESDGTTTCRLSLGVDDNPVVTLTAVDPDDGSSSTSITLLVDPSTPPTVQIRSPEAGTRWYTDQPVPLDALVSDPDQPARELQLAWASDVDGPLLQDRRADMAEDPPHLCPRGGGAIAVA